LEVTSVLLERMIEDFPDTSSQGSSFHSFNL